MNEYYIVSLLLIVLTYFTGRYKCVKYTNT